MTMFDKNKTIFALHTNSIKDIPKCEYDILAIDYEVAKNGLPKIQKPIMICSDNISPSFVEALDRQCIISYVTEKNYKNILPSIIEGGHLAVLKTPIDINLAKELNILAIDLGLSADKIIMNTDIGALGYGYEYGFSIMEKVKIESKKDKYLDFPIYCEASTESLKTKEAKSACYGASWGNLELRARMIELSACAGAIAAGANILSVHYPENIEILRRMT